MINKETIKKVNEYLENEFLQDQARYKHIMNVLKVALDLGEIFVVDKDELTVAALLHDATKMLNFKENYYLASKMFSEEVLNQVPIPCLHAYSAAALAKEKFDVQNQDVLNAITFHCSGRPKMSNIEKIIFVSDFIEDERDFVTDDLRGLARIDLNKTVYLIMLQTKNYLLKNKKTISELTELALKDYESEVGEFND
ncbi:MAG: bis(5'-nucleosyl)-tetraphosphatase (symmetrical) YqeK [Candidatus Izemoplasmatales bacterium]|nr:bis(5'-nucleosyl)-tetraphosphatase (symmetrical) YqeK [Candidatus Izemoplasmatales bacterium]